jgi:hypothetical protein
MSLFKTTWIILKKKSLKENEDFLVVFTDEYWKINLKAKKTKTEKSLDFWYIINFEVSVKWENNINKIRNIKIKNELNYNKYDYKIIFEYLNILSFIEKNCPLNMQNHWIFEILNKINSYDELTFEKLLFAKAKILNILWILKTENQNENIKKVLLFIEKNSIENILKLKWLSDDDIILFENMLKD